jgi:hypothetical protein
MKIEELADRLNDTTEVVNQQDKRIADLENKGDVIPEYPKIYIPDYTKELKFLNKQLEVFLRSDHQHGLDAAMKNLERKIDSIPQQIKIKTTHDFGIKSLAAKSMGVLLILTYLFVWWLAYSRNELKDENDDLQHDSTNYYFVKALYPEVAKYIEFNSKAHSKEFKRTADSAFAAQGAMISKGRHRKSNNGK